jgi:hypothetical protein
LLSHVPQRVFQLRSGREKTKILATDTVYAARLHYSFYQCLELEKNFRKRFCEDSDTLTPACVDEYISKLYERNELVLSTLDGRIELT